jgi:predicted phage terminase large subunit-like protein
LKSQTHEKKSKLLSLASLPLSKQKEILASLSDKDHAWLKYAWEAMRRPEQTEPPGNWDIWAYVAGRGSGKTRTAAEFVREKVETQQAKRIHIVARTAADVRDVAIEGESGILAVSLPSFRPIYEPSKRRLTWPNGATATTFTAETPDQLRGPQCDLWWGDETAAWKYDVETFDQIQFGARLGAHPRGIITTTPRPTKLMRSILADSGTAVTRGTTYDNVVVAIDPATTSGKQSDDTGIVVVGLGEDGHGYVLDDLTCHESPNEWAKRAIRAYHEHKADRIIGEVNNGGDLVETVIRSIDPDVPFSSVHASRGKYARAEPVAALYEQGRVHHVGSLPELEDQQCTWLPTDAESPDRIDAAVWGLTSLLLGQEHVEAIAPTTEGLDMGDRW